jgi:phage/plasmid-like protein (TIGR03299 family)
LIRTSDNTILAPNVGTNWEPLQNDDAFEFFSEFVDVGGMRMHTAGSLKDGQIVWALAEVDDSFNILGGDKVNSFLLLSNHHVYGESIKVQFTPIRVVCANTLAMALGKKDGRVNWSHKMKFDPEYVKETLGISHRKLETYKESALKLASKKYTDETVLEFLGTIHPVTQRSDKALKKEVSKHAKTCYDLLETQPGAEFAPKSWWNAFNAVTYNVDHIMCKTQDQRLTEAWFGAQVRTKQKAFELALEYAEAA